MVLRLTKFAFVLLLGFLMGGQGVFTVSGGATSNTCGAKSGCCCTGCDFKHCLTPACCARPADQRAPAMPASVPPHPSNEGPALAAAWSTLLSLPLAASTHISPPSFQQLRAVPIFQRDCSYLI